jgi:FecR protein
MHKPLIVTLLASLAAATVAAETPAIGYRFEDVRRSVTVTTATRELTATRGLRAQSGDKVHTGWFAYALIASEPYRARFEIFAMTDVELAGGTPGVLLSVDRGRIRAVFDKITGSEPRVVKTPGALLAVRGTQFDVEVDKSGRTTVDVYEGIVEVRSEFRHEPLMLRAGEESIFGQREPPSAHPISEDRRRNAPPARGENKEGEGSGRKDGPHSEPPPGQQPRPPSMMPPQSTPRTPTPPATGTHH